MKGPTTTLEVPITEAHVPNLYVQVDLVGSAPRVDDDGKPDDKLPRRPAYGKGQLNLPVPPVTRTLKVGVKPRATQASSRAARPGSTSRCSDVLGRPVAGAELSVVVVDEAVLALSQLQDAQPARRLLSRSATRAPPTSHIRQYVTLARPDLGIAGQRQRAGAAAWSRRPRPPPRRGGAADDESGGDAGPARRRGARRRAATRDAKKSAEPMRPRR